MKLRRAILGGVAALLIPLGGTLVACGDSGEDDYATATVAEDCDYPDDQANREDDCGYWESPDDTQHRMGSQPAADWLWVWYAWVIVGRTSTPPAGWKPPYGLRHPTKVVRVNRKNCALGQSQTFQLALKPGWPAPAPVRQAPPPPRPAPPAPPPAPRPPAVNNAPKAPNGNPIQQNKNTAPKAPVYKPPSGRKIAC